MSRARIYPDNAERQRAFRERRQVELSTLRQKVARHPRHDHDLYETPPAFAAAGLALVTGEPEWILDVGAGPGVWGRAARARWRSAEIVGVELRDVPQPDVYDQWITGDFLEAAPELPRFDLVMGNPPYAHAEAFIRAGLSLLKPGGELLFFLRLSFREGLQRGRGLFREHPLAELSVCDRRPIFYGDGKRNGMTAFAFYRWSNPPQGETRLATAAIPRVG
jgi:hypothetical protein